MVLLLLGCLDGWADVAQHQLEDPTRPLRAPVVGVDAIAPGRARPTLNSVLFGAERRVAVIDGHRMTEGQVRSGIRVWEIRPDGVVVSVDGSPRIWLSIASAHMHKELR